jgi:hypothetical protein
MCGRGFSLLGESLPSGVYQVYTSLSMNIVVIIYPAVHVCRSTAPRRKRCLMQAALYEPLRQKVDHKSKSILPQRAE